MVHRCQISDILQQLLEHEKKFCFRRAACPYCVQNTVKVGDMMAHIRDLHNQTFPESPATMVNLITVHGVKMQQQDVMFVMNDAAKEILHETLIP